MEALASLLRSPLGPWHGYRLQLVMGPQPRSCGTGSPISHQRIVQNLLLMSIHQDVGVKWSLLEVISNHGASGTRNRCDPETLLGTEIQKRRGKSPGFV